MSNDDYTQINSTSDSRQDAPPYQRQAITHKRSFFSIPPTVKHVFDKFPLITYDENDLPLWAPTSRQENVLHVFVSEEGSRKGRPSFNPTCLKWQVGYLRLGSTKEHTR